MGRGFDTRPYDSGRDSEWCAFSGKDPCDDLVLTQAGIQVPLVGNLSAHPTRVTCVGGEDGSAVSRACYCSGNPRRKDSA